MTVSTITTPPLERGRTLQEALTFAATTPSDNSEHVRTLYDLTRALRPKIAVEIGVGFGWFTTALLAALEGSDGRLISVDRVDYPETRRALASPQWDYRVEDVETFAREWDGPIELLVFDHSHVDPSHTMYPLRLLQAHIALGGAVVIHATASHPELADALRDFAGAGWNVEEKKNNCGLMILRRLAA